MWNLPGSGIKPVSHWQAYSLPLNHQGSLRHLNIVSIRLDLSYEPQIPEFHKKHLLHIRAPPILLLGLVPGRHGKFSLYQRYSRIHTNHCSTDILFCYSLVNPKMKWSEVKLLSHVRLFATPWTVAYYAPPSTGFSRQAYWSGLPFPSPADLPDPGIEPRSRTL